MVAEGDALILVSGGARLAAWWLSAGALAVVSWALVRARSTRRYGWLGFGVSLAVMGIVIPGVANERIVISPQALTIHTGLWFEPTVIHYPLANFIRAHEVLRHPNWYRSDYFLVLEAREGPPRRYRMGDFFIANRDFIFSHLAAAGLEVERAPTD